MKYIEKYTDVLSKTPRGDLSCLFCIKIVNSNKYYNIDAPLNSKSHLKRQRIKQSMERGSTILPMPPMLDFNLKSNKLVQLILNTFMSADILLFKKKN